MGAAPQQLIDPGLSTPTVACLAVAIASAWIASHGFKRKVFARPLKVFFFLCRVGLGTVAIWVSASLAARLATLGFVLPLWMIAVLGGLAIELIVALCISERRMVGARGKVPLAIRIAAALWLIVALLEPVSVETTTRRWQREVAVIVDDSASMHITDERSSPGYELEVAAAFGVEAASHRPRHGDVANSLRAVAGVLDRDSNGFFDDEVLEEAASSVNALPAELDAFDHELRGKLQEHLQRIGRAQRDGDAAALDTAEQDFGDAVAAVLKKLETARPAAETEFLATLDPQQRQQIREGSQRTRADIAREALSRSGKAGADLLSAIQESYKLRFYFAAADLSPAELRRWRTAENPEGFQDATDLGGALDSVLQAVPPELLAGAVVASDGAHNAGSDLDGPTRGFALRKAPVGVIALGSSTGTFDAAVTGVHAPRVLRLGKRIAIEADLKFQNMAGRKAEMLLREDGKEVDRKAVDVRDGERRMSVAFDYLPQRVGVREYAVEIEPAFGEQIVKNNTDATRVHITEDEDEVDAIDVLLVDAHPRWEFRYLRNLFDGRDESVRLQHLLIQPEAIAGAAPLAPVSASAARPFGDSRATQLPSSAAEWSAFEVIIIGDVSPADIDSDHWATIEECVDRSGTLLVLIAGKNAMPHRFGGENFTALAPARYPTDRSSPLPGETGSYKVRWTPAGIDSRVLDVTPDLSQTRAFWDALPAIHWRHPVTEIKPGAEVLAYAAGAADEAAGNNPDELAKRNALIVTHRYGKGRVVAMNFDRTYRMRYGFGERFHHRFWWQLIHWKGGEEFDLDSLVELKVDRERYEFGTPVEVIAKAVDTGDEPLPGPLSVKVIASDGSEILRQTLIPRTAGHGVFEATLRGIPADDEYEVILEGDGIAELLSEGSSNSVAATFAVEPAKSVELRDLAARPDVLEQLARRTGGVVAPLHDAASLAELFVETHVVETTSSERFLWDRSLFLLVFVILIASEWILRRKAGMP